MEVSWELQVGTRLIRPFDQAVLISIYRVTFHPLAKYPGPFLDKISDWPLVFHCYNGNRHLVEYRNHQKYGMLEKKE